VLMVVGYPLKEKRIIRLFLQVITLQIIGVLEVLVLVLEQVKHGIMIVVLGVGYLQVERRIHQAATHIHLGVILLVVLGVILQVGALLILHQVIQEIREVILAALILVLVIALTPLLELILETQVAILVALIVLLVQVAHQVVVVATQEVILLLLGTSL